MPLRVPTVRWGLKLQNHKSADQEIGGPRVALRFIGDNREPDIGTNRSEEAEYIPRYLGALHAPDTPKACHA